MNRPDSTRALARGELVAPRELRRDGLDDAEILARVFAGTWGLHRHDDPTIAPADCLWLDGVPYCGVCLR